MKRKKWLWEKSNRIWENCLTIKYFRASFLSERTQQCETERSGFSCEEILYVFFPSVIVSIPSVFIRKQSHWYPRELYNTSFVCLLLNVKSHYHVLSQSSPPLFSKDLKESWPYHRVNNALWAAHLLSVRKRHNLSFCLDLLATTAQHNLWGSHFSGTTSFCIQKRERQRKRWGKLHLKHQTPPKCNHILIQIKRLQSNA